MASVPSAVLPPVYDVPALCMPVFKIRLQKLLTAALHLWWKEKKGRKDGRKEFEMIERKY